MSIYNLKSNMNFGKYSGLTIKEILSRDPSYLIWAFENIEWFELDKEVLDEAVEKSLEVEIKRYIKRHVSYYPDAFDEYFQEEHY